MTVSIDENQVGTMQVRAGSGLTTDELLVELRCRGWTLVRWGPRDLPVLLAAMFRWRVATDVVILRGKDDASAYRVPFAGGDEPVWNPWVVSYQFHSCALWTLRAILTIGEPGSSGAPDRLEPAAAACRLPDRLPRPVLIRPLSPCPR